MPLLKNEQPAKICGGVRDPCAAVGHSLSGNLSLLESSDIPRLTNLVEGATARLALVDVTHRRRHMVS